MHPKVEMFLRDRDRARARGDYGIDRAITADLRRLGIPDEATLVVPVAERAPTVVEEAKPQLEKKKGGRPPKPRCEHGVIAERCEDCKQAEIEDSRP